MGAYILPYKDRDNAFIVVKLLKEPYGPNTEDVVSIGSTLKGDTDNPRWKVHVPANLMKEFQSVIESLNHD
mgnify:FL=1|jgi:hypothetical protein